MFLQRRMVLIIVLFNKMFLIFGYSDCYKRCSFSFAKNGDFFVILHFQQCQTFKYNERKFRPYRKQSERS